MQILRLLKEQCLNYEKSSPLNMVFIGDSVTHGAFECYITENNKIGVYYDFEAVFHSRLKRYLNMIFPAARINIINAGISGDDSKHGLERLKRDVVSYSPGLVVVCFGLNDVQKGIPGIESYTNSLQGIFKILSENQIETIFLTPNMLNTYVSKSIKDDMLMEIAQKTSELQNNGVMDLYMEAARDICSSEAMQICDCYKIWNKLHASGADVTSLLSNYINHPTREMHDIFAFSLFKTILDI